MKSARKFLFVASAVIGGALLTTSLVSQSPYAAEGVNKEEVQAIIKDYLMENPSLVIEAIEAYQENQQQIEQKKADEAIAAQADKLADPGLPFAGNPDGDITIVEFFDYNCGYCKKALTEVKKLLDKDDNVKVIFHEMPILRNTSNDAAMYAYAAHKQGKYWEYHQALMTNSGQTNVEGLEKLAEKVGLDVEKLRKDAQSTEVKARVEESLALSRELGIRGTPAFIIEKTMVPGYIPAAEMERMIKTIRDNRG